MRNTLFSDYYLERLYPEDQRFQAAGARVGELTALLAPLFEEVDDWAPGAVEAELEDRLIRPVLRALGYPYLVQTALRESGQRTPDYLLFASDDERRSAERDRGSAARHANALGEAKRWDLPLDRRSSDGYGFDSANPSFQVDTYLRDTELQWAILTNGRHWRLYHRSTSFRLDSFFEVDLAVAISDAEEMRNFIAFFARDALPGAAQSFVDRALQDSVEYAQALGTSLESNVYEALRLLSEGLYADALRRDTGASVPTIRDAAFTVIFRLLFVLYAESRGYLPVEDATYDLSHSLRRLAHEVAELGVRIADLSTTSMHYWSRLRGLFALIRDGSQEDPRLEAYDGGLFEDTDTPLLNELGVDDRHLAEAIRRLTRADVRGRGQGFVSYQDLGVRELGTIYEGLLEQHVFVAEEEMVTVRRGAAEVYSPAATATGRVLRRYPAGSIMLRTDTGERRDTGSYYTPESVVRYMTTSAITKGLERRRVEHDPVEAVLGMRIVDPAMGSGHFLVDAIDVLARELVAALSGVHGDDTSEIRWARREVVERCIYGVDSNPLAVELAKLSLWLVTMQVGKPLSFLDHHLRLGNSLNFIPLQTALDPRGPRQRVAEQEGFWGDDDASMDSTASPHLTAAMRTIATRPTEHLEDVVEKKALYQAARERYRAVREYLDLAVAARFDPELVPAVDVAYLILYQGGAWELAAAQASHEAAREIASTRRFFHWESEFPEVLAGDDRGFDVVLSNPPYVSAWRHHRKDPLERAVLRNLPQFSQVARGHWDLFIPFVALGRFIARQGGGILAYVLPNPAHREGYGTALREELMANCDFLEVVDYGSAALFEDVSRQSVTWMLRTREEPITAADEINDVTILDPNSVQETPDEPVAIGQVPQAAWRENEGQQIRVDVTAEEAALSAHFRREGVRLRTFLTIKYGAQVSGDTFGRERYLGFSPDEMANPKRFLEGRDLRPYTLNWPGRYLDYQPEQFYGPREPSLFESPKLIVRHLSGDGHMPLAVADGLEFYTDHGCILGNVATAGLAPWPTLMAVVAVLNSSAGAFYYQANFATDSLQGEFSHVYPAAVKNSLVPTVPTASEIAPMTDIFDGDAWAGVFQDPDSRAEHWSVGAASLASRLHEIARELLQAGTDLAAFTEHVTRRPLAASWPELFAAGQFSTEAIVEDAEAAFGAGIGPDQWARIREAAAAAIQVRDALADEARRLEVAIDELVEDAFHLPVEMRAYLHSRIDYRTLRRSRLWSR